MKGEEKERADPAVAPPGQQTPESPVGAAGAIRPEAGEPGAVPSPRLGRGGRKPSGVALRLSLRRERASSRRTSVAYSSRRARRAYHGPCVSWATGVTGRVSRAVRVTGRARHRPRQPKWAARGPREPHTLLSPTGKGSRGQASAAGRWPRGPQPWEPVPGLWPPGPVPAGRPCLTCDLPRPSPRCGWSSRRRLRALLRQRLGFQTSVAERWPGRAVGPSGVASVRRGASRCPRIKPEPAGPRGSPAVARPGHLSSSGPGSLMVKGHWLRRTRSSRVRLSCSGLHAHARVRSDLTRVSPDSGRPPFPVHDSRAALSAEAGEGAPEG